MNRLEKRAFGRSRAFALALGLLSASARPVEAQREGRPTATADDEARALYDAGVMAYSNGRFADALGRFDEAYRLSHRPALLFNIASCEDRLRRDRDALDDYRRYLEAVPDAGNRPFVEERIRFLESAVSAAPAPAASAAPVATVPTPTETADRAVVVADSTSAPDSVRRDGPNDRPLYKKWWLWTIVGTVVVAAIAVPIAVTQSGSQSAPLETGSTGSVVFTLGAR